MLRRLGLMVLCTGVLGACSSAPRGPVSELELGPSHPMVRPALLPFETPEVIEASGGVVVPLLPGRTPATGNDPLADDGTHLRIRLNLGADGSARIESVAVGAGTARADLGDGRDLVLVLVGKGGDQLARVGLRQPLVERVYPKAVAQRDPESAALNRQHGKRQLQSAALTVFLPGHADAARVEVRLGGDKGRLVAEYTLQ